jgi:hypothetical protein
MMEKNSSKKIALFNLAASRPFVYRRGSGED